MPMVQVTTGDENLKQAIAKVYVFHSPTDESSKELALSRAAKDEVGKVKQVGSHTFIGAVIGIKPQIGGQWVTTSYDIVEGEIIKIFASKKTTWKGLLTTACLFLRIRQEAPLHKIKVKLLNSFQTKLKTADIVGRFDVLTLEEARSYGVTVMPHFESYFAPIVTSALFEVEVLEKSTAPKEKIETTVLPAVGDAPEIVVRRRKQRRSLELNP